MDAPKIAKRERGVARNSFKCRVNNAIFQPGSADFLAWLGKSKVISAERINMTIIALKAVSID